MSPEEFIKAQPAKIIQVEELENAYGFYDAKEDLISVLTPDQLGEIYHEIVFHELVHWTRRRLGRSFFDIYEDLVACIGAQSLCATFGIPSYSQKGIDIYTAKVRDTWTEAWVKDAYREAGLATDLLKKIARYTP